MARADRDDEDAGIDLGTEIADLFAGPPEQFVAGRDALVRGLRAAGRADDIAEVKALRKPKAVARALDVGARADPAAVEALAAAVDGVGEAQSDGGDVRAALAALRDAERAVTEATVAAVAGEERPPDASTVGAAVRAVLADPEALAALRSGTLADVPAGGGLGLAGLGGTPAPSPERRERTPTGRPASERPAPGPADKGKTARPPRRRRAGARRTPSPGGEAGTTGKAATAGKAEPKALVAARRAVADAEHALGLADGALDEAADAVAAAEADERAARDAADEAARRADDARDRALEVARVATAARREAAARNRRRDEAAGALAKAEARLSKLDPG